MPHTLLQADSAALTFIQAVFSAIVSLALWRLSAWQRRYEGLEHRLHDATGRLVDQRLAAMSAALESHVRASLAANEELQKRLLATDRALAEMADRDLKIELTVTSRFDMLKDYLRDFAVGKTDLERYESAVDRRLTRIETRLEEIGRDDRPSPRAA